MADLPARAFHRHPPRLGPVPAASRGARPVHCPAPRLQRRARHSRCPGLRRPGLRGRFAKFGLELHPDKTRLIEFGRHAARDRAARGKGKPETFDFLGFTHICAKSRNGRFWLKRITISKRMRAKLKAVNDQLRRRMHQPIPEQGRWLASVVGGHMAYYAVPGNYEAVVAFCDQVTRYWLRRRSQKTRVDWTRMVRIRKRWLPPVRVIHPFPEARFAATHPR